MENKSYGLHRDRPPANYLTPLASVLNLSSSWNFQLANCNLDKDCLLAYKDIASCLKDCKSILPEAFQLFGPKGKFLVMSTDY